jgi:hypothetical protein
MSTNLETHAGMSCAAIFRTDAAISAGLIGANAQAVRMSRNSIDLAAEAGYPETVNDILAFGDDFDRSAGRYMQDPCFCNAAGQGRIGKVPLPHPPNRANLEGVFGVFRGALEEEFTLGEGVEGQCDQNRQGKGEAAP